MLDNCIHNFNYTNFSGYIKKNQFAIASVGFAKIHAEMMATKTALMLNLNPENVIITSTGIIGVPLPIDKICMGIEHTVPKLGCSELDAFLAAEAILTTDKYSKQIAVEIEIAGKTVHIGGMAKGSGMIHPNMATMLSFITSDVNISQNLLQKLLTESVGDTYNMISVDGDTSTNDQVTVIANGEAGNDEIVDEKGADYQIFKEAFHHVNTFLAKQIVRDEEGATKFVTVNILGAASKVDAKKLSKSIITSSIVKTTIFWEDVNWGRIIAAMGYSGGNFNPDSVSINFANKTEKIDMLLNGVPIPFDEEKALKILQHKEISFNITLNDGNSSATAWGCDLI